MRIAVISPHVNKNGTTTVAMLIAMELASSGKLTCLTHVKPKSEAFSSYLNFKGFNDKTSTPSQIVKILREGALTGDDARAYCKDVSYNLEAFTNEASNFSEEDMAFMYKYIAKAFPHENVVFDVDSEDFEVNKSVVKLCDVAVIVISQNAVELKSFRENKDKYIELLAGKPYIFVVNRYNSISASLKEVAKWAGGSKPKNFNILHDNPWIRWATNHGKLNELARAIIKKDPRVIEIQSDLSRICTAIAKAKVSKDKTGKK